MKMLNYLILAVFLLAYFQASFQTKVTELEICERKLKKCVTVFNGLRSHIDNITMEKFELRTIRPSNCAELLKLGDTESGIYTIYPTSWNGTFSSELSVYCDMETDGGGWIVFQRRGDYQPQQDFFQGWETYKRGFGRLDKDFWLGNENLHVLTNQENVTLRVDLEDFENNKRFATYDDFRMSNCEDKYRLQIGVYTGDAGDSLSYHRNFTFATFDNDGFKQKCANKRKGAWWYDNCNLSNLNGLYKRGASSGFDMVSWYGFKGHDYSLKKSEMKFRPSNFNELK